MTAMLDLISRASCVASCTAVRLPLTRLEVPGVAPEADPVAVGMEGDFRLARRPNASVARPGAAVLVAGQAPVAKLALELSLLAAQDVSPVKWC